MIPECHAQGTPLNSPLANTPNLDAEGRRNPGTPPKIPQESQEIEPCFQTGSTSRRRRRASPPPWRPPSPLLPPTSAPPPLARAAPRDAALINPPPPSCTGLGSRSPPPAHGRINWLPPPPPRSAGRPVPPGSGGAAAGARRLSLSLWRSAARRRWRGERGRQGELRACARLSSDLFFEPLL